MNIAGPIAAILLPNAGGWAGGIITMKEVRKGGWYSTLEKPKWTPPNWVFGPTWTVLYSGMGYASYLVYQESGGFTEKAALPLALYGTQLALNWAWTPIFFHYHQLQWGFVEIVALSGAAALTTGAFFRSTPLAGYLMLPYLAWLGVATALNYSIWRKNDKRSSAKITEINDDVKKN